MNRVKNPKINIWLRIVQAVLLILLLVFIILSFMDITAAQTGSTTVTTFSSLMVDLQGKVGVLIGILATVMVVIGGIVYAASGGDPSKMNLGKEIILSAIAGLVLFMFTAWFLGEDLGIGRRGGVIGRFFWPY